MMRQTLDTFLHLLADNLSGIPVRALRRDPSDPNAGLIQTNAVNVKVVNTSYDWHIGVLQVSLDVVNDSELTALDWTQQVWNLLKSAFFTPQYDYSPVDSGGQPQPTGNNIFWNTSAKFRPVHNEYYSHFTCVLNLHSSNN